MKKSKILLALSLFALSIGIINATEVSITMNTISTTMTLTPKGSEEAIAVGEPTSRVYTFEAPAGTYTLTAYANNGTTINGMIDITIEDSEHTQAFNVFTITAYATNSGWVRGEDYSLDVKVTDGSGNNQNITTGESTTQGRTTFLALKGNSYNVAYIPSQTRQEEGYTTGYKGGAITANVTAGYAIPMAGQMSISTPIDANLKLGIKFTHFTDFTTIAPTGIDTLDNSKIYNYTLANSQVYNYRASKEGGLTHAGYFTMSTDPTKCPELSFTDDDFTTHDPKDYNHDANSNNGYETGDIFVNINPQNLLQLCVGDMFDTHVMRSWELTDNSVNNYFIEPDFHYQVIDFNGQPSSDIIEIDETQGSAWAKIKAVGIGEVVVLVTYDGINLNYYSSKDKKEYLGGQYWGAIWPENTAVYVVSVGKTPSTVQPNMTINEKYNDDSKKNAGKYVDAEHDVFYYLDSEDGYKYQFFPDNVASVEIAYPTISEHSVTFSGFQNEGVTKAPDGSYTLLLKQGRQIIKLTDNDGNSTYQVLTAKSCHREITNLTNEESTIFLPGNQVKVQYSGLYHPANKMAGIYNMSASLIYNNIPEGTIVAQGSSQYTFGSSAAAQAITFTIPEDYDMYSNPQFIMDEGAIKLSGFGDPIGNHRAISHSAGRSPNFSAIAHTTIFGALPPIIINLNGHNTPTSVEQANDKAENSNNIDSTLTIYDLSGRLIKTNATNSDLQNLTKGIYIIHSNNLTKKLLVK